VAGLEPHIAQSLARPDENQGLVLLYAVGLTRSGRSEKAAEVLRKLVERSPRWRSIAAGCDPAWLGDTAGATTWLRMCAALIPDDDVASRVVLARAWGAAWETYRGPELLAQARRVLSSLAASPNPPIDVLVTAATIDQGAGELEAARRGYVAALARDPARIDARNNLAVVLADLGQWQKAEEEATKVVQAAPKVAECLETLSYAQRKGKAFDRARANLAEAIRLEPANPKWAVVLAETLAEAGDSEELTRQLSRIETAFPGSALPVPLRERVDRLASSHK
jgi:tetratricopeptide (TPR) repeat protein